MFEFNKKYGICHLCGKETNLTYEHVPPQKANNMKKVRMYNGESLEELSRSKSNNLKYLEQQRGAGGYTLCKECNNLTGHLYADEYIKFANEIGYYMTNKTNLEIAKEVQFSSDELYFQRIIKQILCMFLSTIQPEFINELQDIRNYILNKESKEFNIKKYRVSMYLLKKPELSHTGILGIMINNKIYKMVFMNLYYLGFVLEIDPPKESLPDTTDISCFTSLGYNDRVSATITCSITERYSFHDLYKNMEKGIKKQKKLQNDVKINN